ncbi:MAG: GntR family transcriptional regulator [Anaerolineae bacterium]|nr:GntR family transcriptional regulator [Anaerolineae bacterium]
MIIRRDSPIPLYQQLYNLLRKQIETGEYDIHDVLPTEEQLAETYGLSRVTVRKALQLLADDHLIMRQAGKGTFVYPRKIEENLQTLQGFAEMMTTAYPTQVMESLSFETLQATGRLDSLLELNPSERVLQIKRRHTVDGIPVAYAVIYLPYEVGRIISPEEVETTPIYALLTAKAGITLKRASQRITAMAADDEIAHALGISTHSPVLAVNRVTYTNEERPVEYIQLFYPGGQHELTMEIYRDDTGNTVQTMGQVAHMEL